MSDELTSTLLEWVVHAFDDKAILIWSIISGPAIACIALLYRTRAYLGWARDRFGIVVAVRSTLGHLVRLDHAAYVPSKYGYVALRPGTADLDVYDEVMGCDAYRIDLDPAPKFIVDAGAHIGLTARVFASQFPSASIYCLEVEERNAALASRNTSGCPNVHVLQAGLWSDTSTVTITNPTAATWSFRVRASSTGIPAFGVLDLMRQFNMPTIDLLKMDVEGAEVDVLETAPAWIDRVGVMIIELHDRHRPACSAALEAAVANAGFISREQVGDLVTLRRYPINAISANIAT
jgi:FkbM family methyltransferase